MTVIGLLQEPTSTGWELVSNYSIEVFLLVVPAGCHTCCPFAVKSIMFSLLVLALVGVSSAYKIGTGIYDVTGPSVEINFMVRPCYWIVVYT